MESSKKVLIFTVPLVGHTNPILAFCKELTTNKNVKIIAYSQSKFKGLIEDAGAEYRSYDHEFITQAEFNIVKNLYYQTNFADLVMKSLYREILNEKPHLIIFDDFAYFIKISLKYILKEFKTQNIKPPKIMKYSTTFRWTKDYPNSYEMSLANSYAKPSTLKTLFYLLLLMLKRLWLIYKYNFDRSFFLDHPFTLVADELNIVFTFPELQTRSHLLAPDVRFVGSCFDTVMHFQGEASGENKLIDSILEEFQENDQDNLIKQKHLIYASLGTVFNKDKNVYLKLIEAFKRIINQNEDLKFSIILSAGQFGFELLKDIQLSKEILIVKSAPQIEILKRASLFITHSGMNGTSEAVHYGVPMVCLPNSADQPWVAYRISDELGLGVRLFTPSFSPNQLKDAVVKVIKDSSFKTRALFFQNLSKNSNGSKNFAEIVIQVLKND